MTLGGFGKDAGIAVGRRALGATAVAAALPGCATTPAAPPRPTVPRPPEPPLAMLRDGRPPTAAGAPLDAAPLRRFYARHGFQPVWPARPAQAAALSEAVLRAAGHGLHPDAFHAAALREDAALPPLERELLLSSAILSFADALAHGQVPPGRRSRTEALAAPEADPAAALHAALDSADPRAALEALAPATPGYAALRAALGPDGPEPADPAGRTRRRALQVNLERQRWLPRELPAERVWVNVADQRLTYFRDGAPVLSSRVVVGNESDRDQSPELLATIEGIFFNPPWVVPADIVQADILPRLRQDPAYLEKRNMVLRENGEVEQRAGPNAGLGALLFDMPNRFDVFLHDTPARHFFTRDNRRLSYGCIRVEKPRELAALLMRRPVEAIAAEIAPGKTVRRDLPSPVPVFVVYHTAFADEDAQLQFRPDFYRRDAGLWQRLRGAAAGPPAGQA